MKALPDEAEFFKFMEKSGPDGKESKQSYISRLRYVGELYKLDFETLTREGIEEVSNKLLETSSSRDRHKTSRAVSDIKSALMKYLSYIESKKGISNLSADILLTRQLNRF